MSVQFGQIIGKNIGWSVEAVRPNHIYGGTATVQYDRIPGAHKLILQRDDFTGNYKFAINYSRNLRPETFSVEGKIPSSKVNIFQKIWNFLMLRKPVIDKFNMGDGQPDEKSADFEIKLKEAIIKDVTTLGNDCDNKYCDPF